MNSRLDAHLVKLGPNLFIDRYAPKTQTAMCWGFDCGNGWYQLLKEAVLKLEPLIVAEIAKDPEGAKFGYYRASQVKEKYGTLRFYLYGETDEMSAVIRKAERQSARTCETCGKPGKVRGRWFYTSCVKHKREQE